MKRDNEHLTQRYIPEDIAPIKPADISPLKNRTGTWRYLTPHHDKRPAPCEAACPLSVPVPDFINELEKGNEKAAGSLIRMENPLPQVCGRVCNHRCEENCSRGSFDMPVAIRSLERFTGDKSSGEKAKGKGFPENSGHSIGVVGGGPGGISAAYFLLLLGYRVTLYEKEKSLGGMLRSGIPEYRLPAEILDEALKPLLSLKPEIVTGAELGSTLSLDKLSEKSAVFFATGAPLSVTFEKIKGGELIVSGISLLEEIRRGGDSHRGKIAAVIGGGNTAVDTARSLLRTGCRPVIVYRRGREEMKAFESEVREAVSEGVEIITGSVVREIVSDKEGITKIKCVKVRGEDCYRGKLTEIRGSGFSMDVDLVVSALGENPEISLYREILEDTGEIIETDRFTRTGVKGIYSGGDLADRDHLVVNALASGKMAAMAIDADLNGMDIEHIHEYIMTGEKGVSFGKYLEVRKSLIKGESPGEKAPHPVKSGEINRSYFEYKERSEEKKLPPEKRRESFTEVELGFDENKARAETGRCFRCGRCTLCENCVLFCPDISTSLKSDKTGVEVDLDYCKGCGICAEECPGGVIEMKRESI